MTKLALGAIFSKKDIRDYRLDTPRAQVFPETFELKLGTVKNQGVVGSCVAHAIATVVEYHNKLQKVSDKMSVGYIYGNRRDTSYRDSGLIVRDALKTTCKYGDSTHASFPENLEVPEIINLFETRADDLFDAASKAHFESFYKLTNESEIKTALMSDGPVIFAIPWYSDYIINMNGELTSSFDENKKSGGHCMVIYGWNERGWLIRNSWGKAWGNSGNAILPYDISIREAWGVKDDKSNTTLKKPYKSFIGKIFAKIINFFLKLFGN